MAVGGADSYANYEVRELKGKEERSRDLSRQHETIVRLSFQRVFSAYCISLYFDAKIYWLPDVAF